MATSDDLWGGQLSEFSFDPVGHSCTLRINALVDGQSSIYEVTCHRVSNLRFRNSIPQPWSYAEVTEAHAGYDAQSGQYTLELILWSEDAELVITCSMMDITQIGG